MRTYKKIVKNKEELVAGAKIEAPKFKVFFFSAPYDKPNTGDGDFVNAMIAANKGIGVESTWIQSTNTLKTGESLYPSTIEIAQNSLPSEFQDKSTNANADLLKKLSEVGSRDFQDPVKFQQMVDTVKNNAERIESVKKIIAYVKENTKSDQQPILALQFRPPETGCFLTPEDLKLIKSAGIKVNITVHEYGLNYTRPHLQAYAHEFFEQADHVFFLNKQDREAAVESTKIGKLYDAEGAVEKFSQEKLPLKAELKIKTYDLASKSSFTQVPPTVKVSTDSVQDSLQRKPNISWFGMIRPWKGIEQAIELASEMQAKQLTGTTEEQEILKGAKVIVAGLPAVNLTMLQLFRAAFKLNSDEVAALKMAYEAIEKGAPGVPKPKAPPSEMWTKWWQNQLDKLKSENRKDLPPVEIYLDVDMDQNIQLHKECLYAYKPDSKGLAGNSSSIISEMAQKCITITKWGYCTPPQFLSGGPYEGALMLSPYIHGDSSTPDKTEPYYKQGVGSPAPKVVLQEIIARQKDLKACIESGKITESRNYQSLQKTEQALNEFFDPTVIALQNALPIMPSLEHILSQRAKPLTSQKLIHDEKLLTSSDKDTTPPQTITPLTQAKTKDRKTTI